MKVHNDEKIRRLKQLRRKGYSIQELVKILPMPKSTVWHHVQSIQLKPEYLQILRSKQGGSKNKSLEKWKEAKQKAKSSFSKFGRSEKILIAAALYWGEGAKRDFSLSNTDPELIKTFLYCLRDLGLKQEDISVHVRLYEDLDQKKAVSFWENVTGSKVRSVNVLKGKKTGKLLYGMCRLRVLKGGFLLKLLQSVKNEIIKRVACSCSSMDRTPHS